jgi:two-component system, OmpR family, sensor kinase
VSLRARVLVGMALVALVLAVAAVTVTRTIESQLLDRVDAELETAVRPGLLGVDQYLRHNRLLDSTDQTPPERLSSLYEGMVTPGGTIRTLFAPNLTEGAPLPDIDVDRAVSAAATGEPFTVGSDGSDLRYRVRATSGGPTGQVFVLALPLDDVDATIDHLVTLELVAAVGALAVLGLVGWWVIHLGIRPLKQMTATASAIAGGDLSQRVPEAAPHTEAGELGVALNRMLGHIEDAFDERARSEERLRQFVGDASHELRTPVTTIRGYAELYQAGGLDDRDELAEAMRRTGQEAVRMGSLVDDMLLLARLDQGRPLASEPVDLAALVDDAARDARAVAPSRSISSSLVGSDDDGTGPLVVRGDTDRLRQVLANVVGNALVHTPPSASISISAERVDGRAVVSVHDEGQGMPPDVAARVFERFYRADPSRSRHRGGSGLGLAIVQATVAAHGGHVSLATAPDQGTTVRLSFPLLRDHPVGLAGGPSRWD